MGTCWLSLVAAGWVLAGCAAEGSYGLELVFPDARAEEIVTGLTIWAADPGGDYVCESHIPASFDEDDLGIYSKASTAYPPPASFRLSKVPRGPVMFLVEARTAEDAIVLRGCDVVNVLAGETVAVVIELVWVCLPDPAGEIPGNGEDDDCDGRVDECATDTDCDDGDPCTVDRCRQDDERCINQFTARPGEEGLSVGESCSDGLDNDCDHLIDGEDPDCNQCQTDADCDDGNPCTQKTCNVDHECVTTVVNNGEPCDDGLYCIDGEVCQDGACVGEPRDCSHLDEACNLGMCDEEQNRCLKEARPDGLSCDDDDPCSYNDACHLGACVGEAYSCDDGKQCTEDICLGNGACNHENITGTCNDDDPCTYPDNCVGGNCQGTPYDCNDNNVCTNDVCDGVGGCDHLPVTGDCDDGDDQTWGDHCVAGVCTGNACQCEDDNPCTDEVCDADGNCTHPYNTNPCDDGDPCTMDDTCDQGVCGGVPADLDDDGYVDAACGGDDCDDGAQGVNPGATEICNGIDDDCDGHNDDVCPAGCTGRTRPASGVAYMFCSQEQSWANARALCEGEGYKLVRIDSGSENDWIKGVCDSLGFDDSWLGGSDLQEDDVWRWTDGDVFWNGDFGGSAPPGMYENWAWPSAPMNDGDHCVEIYLQEVDPLDGHWNDASCSGTKPSVCKLY